MRQKEASRFRSAGQICFCWPSESCQNC